MLQQRQKGRSAKPTFAFGYCTRRGGATPTQPEAKGLGPLHEGMLRKGTRHRPSNRASSLEVPPLRGGGRRQATQRQLEGKLAKAKGA
jgi:hypothetical protein